MNYLVRKNRRMKTPFLLRMMQFTFSKLGPVFPRFFADRAYGLWFTTHRFKRPALEEAAANTAERSTIHINGTDVTVWSWGKGAPVLFIHGWSGRGTQAAPFLEPLLASGYRVISYDGPAHGDTGGKQTNMLELADVVLALGERYGPFHSTVTHSFGGMVLAYACTLGFTASSAVCICPPASIKTILGTFQRALQIPDSVLSLMTDRLFSNYGNDLEQRASTLTNVRTLRFPAFVIHDENDDEVPWQDGKAVADAWPGSRFLLTHGLGHSRVLRHPDTVASVTEFIKNA